MSDKPEKDEIHEIAGGWITERKNTPIPGFLKLTYLGFPAFGLYYMFRYWLGETDHATRGPLVAQINQATGAPAGWWHILLGVIFAAYVAGLLWFVFLRKEEE
ncbi:MAG: hypothetical protein U0002_16070 [Thermoanaerobaculia bacterium]